MKLFEISKKPIKFDEEKFEKYCQFYFSQLGELATTNYFWRGTDSENIKTNAINPFRPRTRPTSLTKRMHARINEFFEDKFGKPFRNGLFVLGDTDSSSVENYGQPYIIVPVGKFEWLTSEEFGDLYIDGFIGVDDFDESDDAAVAKREEEFFEEIIGSKKWIHNKNLKNAITSGNEVMLWCPEGYYAFDYDEPRPAALF